MHRPRYTQPVRRLFIRRRSRFSSALLALAAIIVTACTETLPPPPPPDYSDIKVEWVAMTYDLAYDGAAAQPGAAALAGLDAFLDNSAVRLTDQVALEAGRGIAPEVAAARAKALEAHLRRRLPGVRVRLLESHDATARVVVGRYVAVQPECEGFRVHEQLASAFRNPDNQVDTNFGCATARNLAATVADPADLKAGRALSPAPSQPHALAIDRYFKLESPHPHSSTKLPEVE